MNLAPSSHQRKELASGAILFVPGELQGDKAPLAKAQTPIPRRAGSGCKSVLIGTLKVVLTEKTGKSVLFDIYHFGNGGT
jgi:hypothetical protein